MPALLSTAFRARIRHTAREAAEVDADLASDVCEQCLADATVAVPVHHLDSRRYRVFSVCPKCLRVGEI
jgi:hypothetical protein